MALTPPVFPRSYEEALEQNWEYVGLFPHPDEQFDLRSQMWRSGYYVADKGFVENGTRVPTGKYALWVKKAPTDKNGEPLHFPLIEFWENWGIHTRRITRSIVGGNSYLGKVESLTARGNSLQVKFSSRMRREGSEWVQDDTLNYVIDLDTIEIEDFNGDRLVLETAKEVITLFEFKADI